MAPVVKKVAASLRAAWMDEDFDVGAETTVKISEVVEVDELTHEQTLQPKDPEAELTNAPQTDIALADIWALIIAAVSLLGVGLILWP